MDAAEQVRDELDKAVSLVTAARRLLATGTMVDLAALEGKVRFVCTSVEAMAPDAGRPLRPAMEALIAGLDRLDQAIRERRDAGI